MPTRLGGEVRARKERVQKTPEPDYASHCTLLRAAAKSNELWTQKLRRKRGRTDQLHVP